MPLVITVVINAMFCTVHEWILYELFAVCTFRTCLNTFRREHDRFWVLAAHPTLNIFAAGLYSLLGTNKHVVNQHVFIVLCSKLTLSVCVCWTVWHGGKVAGRASGLSKLSSG